MLAHFLCKYATHAIHASTSSAPFLKLVWKFYPLKNCYFRNFDLYFDQKIIIIKRHLQVYAACYSKFGTCAWISSYTWLYITVPYVWVYLLNPKPWVRPKAKVEMHIRNSHIKSDNFGELMVVFNQYLFRKVWILLI